MVCLQDFIRTGLALPLVVAVLTTDTHAQDLAIAAQFEDAGNFHRGVAPVVLDKHWGLIDRSGAWVVSPRYTGIRRGGDGLFAVEQDGVWGYIDAKGHSVVAPRFEDADPFQNGVAAVKANGRWGYIRPDGSMETGFIFLELGGREGVYVSARDGDGWAVFKLLRQAPPKREAIQSDLSRNTKAQHAYSISDLTVIAQFRDGEELIEIQTGPDEEEFGLKTLFPDRGDVTRFVSIRRMSDGFAAAATAPDKWGYLHKSSAAFVWPGRFQDAFEFSQGFAPVKINGKWGYIDRAGRVAIQPVYSGAYPFRGNYAVIGEGEKRGFLRLDPQGGISTLIQPRFDDAFRFTEGLAPVKIGERWGYISDGQTGSELIDTGISIITPR